MRLSLTVVVNYDLNSFTHVHENNKLKNYTFGFIFNLKLTSPIVF